MNARLNSDAEAFLIDFHEKHPGCTPQAFSEGKAKDGRSSYDRLTHLIPARSLRPVSLLDLACGDGFLLHQLANRADQHLILSGIDMSPGELNVAQRQPAKTPITWIEGKAQSIPLPDGSIDFVLCHMAFMLMEDIELVVQEVCRVLRAGGTFSAIIGGQGRNGPIYDHFLDLLKEEFSRDQKAWTFKLGDKRVRSEDGIRSLFGSQFEQPIEVHDFELNYSTSPDSAVQWFMLMYDIGFLSAESRKRLAANLLQRFKESSGSNGEVSFQNHLRQITCRKAKTRVD